MRGQAAMEFLVLTGFMVAVFSTFYVVVQERAAGIEEQQRADALVTVADVIRQEVLLAQQVQRGYERPFELPIAIDGQEYSIRVYPVDRPSEIVINTSEHEYVIFLETNLSPGSIIAPGWNWINKSAEGNISVNPDPKYVEPSGCIDDESCPDDGLSCTDNICDLGTCTYVDACTGGSTCTSLGCTCPQGFTYCGEEEGCVDLSDDEDNCGTCGFFCDPGYTCEPTGNDPPGRCTAPVCTTTAYMAGGTSALGLPTLYYAASPQGVKWTSAKEIVAQVSVGGVNISTSTMPSPLKCCDPSTCPGIDSCVTKGTIQLSDAVPNTPSLQQWVCEDKGDGVVYYRCASGVPKPRNMTSADGLRTYCCSQWTSDPDGAGPKDVGQWAFNYTVGGVAYFADYKKEEFGNIYSCTNGQDDDCDNIIDAVDPGCGNCPPAAATNLGQSSVTATSATLTWTNSTALNLSSQTIIYGTDRTNVEAGCAVGATGCVRLAAVKGTVQSQSISGLTGGQTYYWVVNSSSDLTCPTGTVHWTLSAIASFSTGTCGANQCNIGGTCYNNNQVDPSNYCQYCNYGSNPNGWTANLSTQTCSDNLGCTINDKCSGTLPATCAGTAKVCGTNTVCTEPSGTCVCTGCTITGLGCVANGTVNTNNLCQSCNNVSNPTGWSPRPSSTSCDDGDACTTGDHCDGASACTYGTITAGNCLISGTCYANGAAITSCTYCNSGTSQTSTTNRASGYSCADASWCNGDETCNGVGVCQNPTDRCISPTGQTCDEAGDRCKETNCADGLNNDGDASTDCADADCSGLTCNDNLYCTTPDTCQGTSCTGPARNCGAGLVCDEPTDTCVSALPAASLTGAPVSDNGNVEGLQLTVKCSISNTTAIPTVAVSAKIGSTSCWYSKWEGVNAVFSCLSPNVADAGSTDFTVECALDPLQVAVSGTNPRTKTVKVCGKGTYYNGASCVSTSCASGFTMYRRSLDAGMRWTSATDDSASSACCPANYCAYGTRCYKAGSVFRNGEANGPFSAASGVICGDYNDGSSAGYALHRCADAVESGQYTRVGQTYIDMSGASFCCTASGGSFRFMPGACPTGTS